MNSSLGLLGGSRPTPAMAYAGGSIAGGSMAGNISFEAAEHAQMLTALRQPLFIQTPLQAMLESMFEKLQTQATVITALQEKVSTLARTNLDSKALLERVRLVEDRVATVTAGSLSPFNQAEVMQRVDALEKRAGIMEDTGKQLQFAAQQDDVRQRLVLCEQRLAGAHNLAGHLMAVQAVAEELDIVIPQPQLSHIMHIRGMEAVAAAANTTIAAGQLAAAGDCNYDMWSNAADIRARAASAAPSGVTSTSGMPITHSRFPDVGNSSSSSPGGSEAVAGFKNSNEHSSPRPFYPNPQNGNARVNVSGHVAALRSGTPTINCSDDGSSSSSSSGLACSRDGTSATGAGTNAATANALCSSGPSGSPAAAAGCVLAVPAHGCRPRVLTRSKQQELQQQIDAGKLEAAALQQQLDDVEKQVAQLRSEAGSSQDHALSMVASLADQLQCLSDRCEAAMKHKEAAVQVVQQPQQQLSLADFTALQGKVEVTAAATAAAGKELQSIKTKELPALSTIVSDIATKLGPGPRAVVSEVDKLLASQLGVLQDQVSGLTVRLNAKEAAELAGQGVATKENLQELSRLMISKPTKDDMRVVLGAAVDLALKAYRNCTGDKEGSGASRTRCLVCERTLLGDKQSRCSNPPHTAPAAPGGSKLPHLEPFRHCTAAVHSSGSRKCAAGRSHGQDSGDQLMACTLLNSSNVSGPVSENNLGPSDALGVGTLGPGQTTRQLRHMAEEHMHMYGAPRGSSNSSSSGRRATAAALTDRIPATNAAPQKLGEAICGILSCSVTPGASSSVLYSSPGPFGANKQQKQQHRLVGRGLSGTGVDGRSHTAGGMTAASRDRIPTAAAAAAAVAARGSSSVGMQGKRTPVFV